MNATRMSRITVAGIAALLLSGPASLFAQMPLVAQSPPSAAPSGAAAQPDRPAVDAMLVDARAAIAAGDLARARALVNQAEQSGVRYPVLHFGDTPAKVRRDLERKAEDAPASDPFLSASRATPLPTPPSAVGSRYGAAPTTPPGGAKAAVTQLLTEARAAMAAGDLDRAETLAGQASRLGVSDLAFAETEDSPLRLAWDLQQRRTRGVVETADAQLPGAQQSGAQLSGAQLPGAQLPYVNTADYRSNADTTANLPASALSGPAMPPQQMASPRIAQLPPPTGGDAAEGLLSAGERALVERDLGRAHEAFRRAAALREQLNPLQQQRLDAHLKLLNKVEVEPAPPVAAAVPAPLPESTPRPAPTPLPTPKPEAVRMAQAETEPAPPEETMIDEADARQKLLARQQSTAVGQAQVEARALREAEPRRALEMLEEAKQRVLDSGLVQEYRQQLARRIDRSIAETKQYIEDNRAQIELDERNAEILAEIDRENAAREKVRSTIGEKVDLFNQLVDEQRFEEAQVVAMRLRDVAPEDPVVAQLWTQAKFIRRNMFNEDIREERDETLWKMRADAEASLSAPVGDDPIEYDPTRWDQLQARQGFSERNQRRTEREIEIERRLKTPVQLRFEDRPLSEVLDSLSQMTGVNIHLDQRGLNQEGVSTDTPVTINLNTEVMLKSALNLILEPLHLGYTVKDEVLKVTSETLRDGDVYNKTYYVADLVIPIPNFVPSNNIGLQGLINDALAVNSYGAGGIGAPGPVSLVNSPTPGGPSDPNSPEVLAQSFGGGAGGGSVAGPGAVTSGPGGLGGAAQADFDSLIDLIVSTVASDTWAENGGGEAEIRPFPTNLSLVISQTQAVHEEIADLLEQLRRLQDLQVTIEVRFITLSDEFFERIGIDFDVNINDGATGFDDIAAGGLFETPRSSAVVGAEAPLVGDLATVTADLDVPFRQGSFDVALPAFGGFSPTDAASFGFAILSEIEAFFLIEAAQGDSRSNVLSAPKVTLFNGQQAFVSDTSQSPFVISVIPVVGEFAAAQQPVIVVLSEGTLLSIQAVVSDDRRYVRLTVVPFFSTIGDVDTFTFDGSTTTSSSSSSSSTDDDDDGTSESASNDAAADTIVAGTTVQLPTFAFTSVTTTVSVPDGGTVLLGGIKELSEGREEFGIPLLSKVPYINRLFRNVGIGRETSTFMMMVTPRIIIQEEEEERLGIAATP